jgi:putative FmdB family regulatory protein
MPIYEYECENCGLRFEQSQVITEKPINQCPECHGKVRRIITGGTGFIFKGSANGRIDQHSGECSLEHMGRTCCGRDTRCEKPPCNE